MKILFLIPVHEKNEIVDDVIRNIQKYNPNDECYFCLIVDNAFKQFDFNYFSSVKNVIITEKENRDYGIEKLQKYITQIKPIICAYEFVKDKIDFEYVVIFHTSQLFVRTGFSNYIKNYETSLRPREWYLQNRFIVPYEKWTLNENCWNDTLKQLPKIIGKVLKWNCMFQMKTSSNFLIEEISKDYEKKFPYAFTPIFEMEILKNILLDYKNMNSYHYQCVEESFYRKNIFDFVVENIKNNLTVSLDVLSDFFSYANVEEILIPTLSNFKSKFVGNNTLYWIDNNEASDIHYWTERIDSNFSGTMKDYHFTVKSVPRNIQHPLREVIRHKLLS
jgi:hypothetical protein